MASLWIARTCFRGHLSADAVADALAALSTSGARFGLVVDCLEMTGYDLDARNAFVAWHDGMRERVAGVAILTTHPLWGMVIRAMSLASGVPMRAFTDISAADDWLERQI